MAFLSRSSLSGVDRPCSPCRLDLYSPTSIEGGMRASSGASSFGKEAVKMFAKVFVFTLAVIVAGPGASQSRRTTAPSSSSAPASSGRSTGKWRSAHRAPRDGGGASCHGQNDPADQRRQRRRRRTVYFCRLRPRRRPIRRGNLSRGSPKDQVRYRTMPARCGANTTLRPTSCG